MADSDWEDIDSDWEDVNDSPKMTMEQANSEQQQAQSRVNELNSPMGVLQETTGLPNFVRNAGSGVMNLLKAPGYAMANQKETVTGILDTLKDPIGSTGKYLSDRYGSYNKIKETAYNDPIGTILDATVLRGLGGVAKAGIKGGIESLPKPTPEKMISDSERLTNRILNPSKDVIADAILKKTKIPAVREAAKVIKKASNHKALINNMDEAIKTNFSQRQQIFEANNYKMTDNHIRDLEDFINQRKSKGQVTSAEIRQMETVLADEKAWHIKNKDKFDRISGESRKEYLQDLTETLIEKRADGSKVVTQPARKQALDILRNGLKEGVEGSDLRVKELNSTYAGLKDAKEMLAQQAAIVEQHINKGVIHRLLLLAQEVANPQSMAINMALRNAKDISKLSGRVENLMSNAMKNKVKMIINDAITSETKPLLGLPNLTPKYLRERQAITPEILGVKGKPVERGIPYKEAIEKYGAPSTSKKVQVNLENPIKDIGKNPGDESYRLSIEAKKKRMAR